MCVSVSASFLNCPAHAHPLFFRYIVFPCYPRTLEGYFQGIIDNLVAGKPSAKLPSEREVLLILIQLCQALVHLQRHRVVHRDFKVSKAGSTLCVELVCTLTRLALTSHTE